MHAKMILVLVLGMSALLSEGCAISVNGQQIGLPGMPQGPLGQLDPAALAAGQIPGQPGATPTGAIDPLTGAVAGALPQIPQDPSTQLAGLQPPTFTPAAPTAPGSTPVDPNATTPAPVAGIPQATPIGSGPIDPASLPTLPAASNSAGTAVALAGAIPSVPGL